MIRKIICWINFSCTSVHLTCSISCGLYKKIEPTEGYSSTFCLNWALPLRNATDALCHVNKKVHSLHCTFFKCLTWEPVVGKKRPLQSDILREKSGHGPEHPHCQSGNHPQHAEHPPGSQQVYWHHFGFLWRGTCQQVTHCVILWCALLAVS